MEGAAAGAEGEDEVVEEGEVEGADEEAREGVATAPGWSSAELRLAGLRSFARFAVSLRAFTRAGAGVASPTVYATTADGGNPHRIFTNLRLIIYLFIIVFIYYSYTDRLQQLRDHIKARLVINE